MKLIHLIVILGLLAILGAGSVDAKKHKSKSKKKAKHYVDADHDDNDDNDKRKVNVNLDEDTNDAQLNNDQSTSKSFAVNGSDMPVNQGNIVVGYFKRCSNNNGNNGNIPVSNTHFGAGIMLSASPANATLASNNQQNCLGPQAQVCSLTTNGYVWDNLSRLRLDVTRESTDDGWKLAFLYGYDAPPVIATMNNERFVPAHLLAPGQTATGATQTVSIGGNDIQISDDGGIRYSNTALFSVDCAISNKVEEASMSVWHDTNHASFKNASALRKRRIVAVGDLHGDMSNSLAVLRMAGIIDRNNNWAGGDNTVFVQTGDVIDRGPDTIDLLKFLPKLIMQANKAGGRAIQILGNHEIMNIGGELKHVSEADYKTFNDKAARKAAFNGNGLLGKRLFKLPVVHQVGDTVFAHGGISQAWAKIGLRSTNERATKIMPEYAKEGVKLDSYESSAIGPTGPAWYRDFAKGDESEVCANLAASLKALGATRMVVGHTFQKDGKILPRCGNRIFVIDVGISQYARDVKGISEPSAHAALEILPDGTVNAIYPKGRMTLVRGGRAYNNDNDDE